MPLSSPKDLCAFLESLGAAPRKRLSQNFLIDGNIIRKIIHVADISKTDRILEIGAGPGALTEALLATGASITAIEKDPLFARALQRFPDLHVFEGDVRSFPLSSLTAPFKVVSNLPFHLTTPILTLLAPCNDLFTSLTLMVQEEVARRIASSPGSSEYSSLTVFLNFYAEVRYEFLVRRTCFYPPPKVDSAVITLILKQPPLVPVEDFFKCVRCTFGQRRKMVKSTLGKQFSVTCVAHALEKIGKDAHARPQELSCTEFLNLFQILSIAGEEK